MLSKITTGVSRVGFIEGGIEIFSNALGAWDAASR